MAFRFPRLSRIWRLPFFALLAFISSCALGQQPSAAPAADSAGLVYTNCRVPSIPWSIHTVEVDLVKSPYETHSTHAGAKAIGLEMVSEQVSRLHPTLGEPVAAINGDFYQREKTFAGAPRGLQVVDGELISAASGGACFWVDALGHPHATNVASLLRVIWPNAAAAPVGLNSERRSDGVVLYTPAVGSSTHSQNGRELVLERMEATRWLPLRVGQTYSARVREIREAGNTSLTPETAVLSIGPKAASKLPAVQPGSILRISTETLPALHGVRTAISGGPVLLRDGKRQKFNPAGSENYESSSMLERHPRSALGWNETELFLVEVDGRQKHLSVGMTLDELSTYLLGLGCTDAINLDGGGSATLWYKGEVKNSPCDRMEREVANAIVVVRRRSNHGTADAGIGHK